jgi:hypothetical protein
VSSSVALQLKSLLQISNVVKSKQYTNLQSSVCVCPNDELVFSGKRDNKLVYTKNAEVDG